MGYQRHCCRSTDFVLACVLFKNGSCSFFFFFGTMEKYEVVEVDAWWLKPPLEFQHMDGMKKSVKQEMTLTLNQSIARDSPK